MRQFRKFTEQNKLISICDYHEADNQNELMEAYLANTNIMTRGSAPASGGPIVAFFYKDEDADEYIKFKNEQING